MSRTCFMVIQPKDPCVEIVYIYVARFREYEDMAKKFIRSYCAHPPGYSKVSVTVMCNGGMPSESMARLFKSRLPRCKLVPHNNSGKDIGAWIAASKASTADLCVYMGSSVHFWKPGWLRRMVDAWMTHGNGVYCMSASYSLTPHFNTTGFWCAPSILASYPFPVVTDEDRYNFEHGYASGSLHRPANDKPSRTFWKMAYLSGYPVMLVTWDGEYHWWDWRTPPNIYSRGNQTNMLAFWNHADTYARYDQTQKRRTEQGNDNLTDKAFDRKNKRFNPP